MMMVMNVDFVFVGRSGRGSSLITGCGRSQRVFCRALCRGRCRPLRLSILADRLRRLSIVVIVVIVGWILSQADSGH